MTSNNTNKNKIAIWVSRDINWPTLNAMRNIRHVEKRSGQPVYETFDEVVTRLVASHKELQARLDKEQQEEQLPKTTVFYPIEEVEVRSESATQI